MTDMTETRPARRWVVLDPSLADHIGHHRAFAAGLGREAVRRDLDVTILGHRALTRPVEGPVAAAPFFRFDPYDSKVEDPAARTLATFVDGVPAILRDLASGLTDADRAENVVVWPTASATALSATAHWLHRIEPARRPSVAAVFHRIDGETERSTAMATVPHATLRLAALELRRVIGRSRLLIGATTAGLAERIGNLMLQPVGACPAPCPTDQAGGERSAARRSGPPLVAFPGMPRLEKGAAELPAVLAATTRRRPEAKLAVQTAASAVDAPSLPPVPDLPQVEAWDGILSDDVYRRLIGEASVVVLPYRRRDYRMRCSAVFVDAVAAGCIMVVPGDTWMGDEIAAGHAVGIAYRDEGPEAVAAAVDEALGRLDPLLAMAAAAVGPWSRRHGVGPWLDWVAAGLGLDQAG